MIARLIALVAALVAALDLPGAPSGLTATVTGQTVTLTWRAPTTGDPPSSYVLEAGLSSGASDVANFDTGSSALSLTAGAVPAGTYFVRVRSRNASGVSAPSSEVRVVVGGGGGTPCQTPPLQPTDLNANVDGMAVSFSWREPQSGAPPSSYVLEAGTAAGLSNIVTLDTGSTARWFVASAPPGVYYIRLRSRNACGTSPPTPDVIVRAGVTTRENVALLIGDLQGNRVVRVTDMAGSNWEEFPRGTGQSLNAPWHVGFDSRRRIYVADRDNNRIVRMDDLSGSGFTTFTGSGGNQLAPPGCSGGGNPPIGCVVSVSIDAADRIYINHNGGITRINDMTGAGWVRISPGPNPNSFNNPKTVAFDRLGRIHVADTDNHRIVRMDDMQTNGWVTYGSFGTGAGQFNRPEGIGVDALGRIYVTDNENHRIIRINDMSGAGWVSYGSYGTGVGNLIEPHDLAVSDATKIYVADTGNGRIVRIDDMTGAGWISFGALKRQPSGCQMTTCELPGMFEFIAIKGLRLMPRS